MLKKWIKNWWSEISKRDGFAALGWGALAIWAAIDHSIIWAMFLRVHIRHRIFRMVAHEEAEGTHQIGYCRGTVPRRSISARSCSAEDG